MYVHARASTLSLQLGKFPSGFRCLLLGHAFSLRAVNPDIKWPRDLLTLLPSVYFPICDEANIVKVPSGSDRTTVPDSNWEMGSRANNVEMLHPLLPRSRSACTTCVGMTMMSLHCLMHMMYPLAREGRREEECSLCPRRAAACFLLSSDRESAFAIRLSLFLASLAFSTLHSTHPLSPSWKLF